MKFDKTIVILGPTASGKTGVAIEIARSLSFLRNTSLKPAAAPSPYPKYGSVRCSTLPRISSKNAALPNSVEDDENSSFLRNIAFGYKNDLTGAEIISADSRAIYRGMEIGTAAPTIQEMQGVPHHGIGIVEPGERFTVADWKAYAEEKITEIRAKGKLPMVVGGTGLYIDALIYDYQFGETKKNDQSDREMMCTNFLTIGIKWTPEELRQRITERAYKLFNDELYAETERLVRQYKWSTQAMKSNIYQFAWRYLQGEISLEEAQKLFILDDWHLAKRQLTWFKRNKNINWLPLAEVKPYVLKCIQDEQRRECTD